MRGKRPPAETAAPGEAPAPFWREKRLDEMTTAEWESLCDGCGRCCLNKLEDIETGEISWTWLPPTCAYRLVDEGRDLYWWHHLVSGDRATVHLAGISVRGRTISEKDVPTAELEEHVVRWPGEDPSVRIAKLKR